VREGYLTHCPPVSRPKRGPRRERWLTRNEAAALLRTARNMKRSRAYLPYVILIGLYHGQRKRAITALQWTPNTEGGFVDLENRLIDFRPIEERETNKRRAHVPINPRVLTFLRYLRRRTRRYVFEQDIDVVVHGRDQHARGPIRDVKRAFANAARATGLNDVTLHTLVHTCCTWLMQAGVPISEAAGFVNKTEQIFSRTYAHHHPDFMRRAIDALARRTG
jgi:integrase